MGKQRSKRKHRAGGRSGIKQSLGRNNAKQPQRHSGIYQATVSRVGADQAELSSLGKHLVYMRREKTFKEKQNKS